MKRALFWIALTCHLVWAAQAQSAAAPGKIILGYASGGDRALPFWMAQELGLFLQGASVK